MTQQSGSDRHPDSGELPSDGALPAETSDDPQPALPAERSRFSAWLASFGLGELQHPLLTRGRPSGTRRPERA
jgi:hypothetical protein